MERALNQTEEAKVSGKEVHEPSSTQKDLNSNCKLNDILEKEPKYGRKDSDLQREEGEEEEEEEDKEIIRDGYWPIRSPTKIKGESTALEASASPTESTSPGEKHSSRFLQRANSVQELVEDFENKINIKSGKDGEWEDKNDVQAKIYHNEEFPSFQDITSPVNFVHGDSKLEDTPMSEFSELLKQKPFQDIPSPFTALPVHAQPSMSLDKLTSLISPEPARAKNYKKERDTKKNRNGKINIKQQSIQAEKTCISPWSMQYSEEGTIYWYNGVTNESVWELSEIEYIKKLADIINLAAAEVEHYSMDSLFDEVIAYATKVDGLVNFESDSGTEKALSHIAAGKGYLHGIQALIDKGVNFNLQDSKGLIPLHYFLRGEKRINNFQNELNIFRILLSITDPATVDLEGNSLMHLIAGDSSLNHLLRELLETMNWHVGENYPGFNQEGDTPLHIAAQAGSIDNVELLLNTTISDPNSGAVAKLAEYSNYKNETADMYAETFGHLRCRDRIKFFLETNKWKIRAEELEKLHHESRQEVLELKAKLLDYLERDENMRRKCAGLEHDLEEWKQKCLDAENRVNEAEQAVVNPEAAWVTMYTSTGLPYFYNNITGESCWEMESSNQAIPNHSSPVQTNNAKQEVIGKVWSKFFENALKMSERKNRKSTELTLGEAIKSLHPPSVMAALAAGASPEKDDEEGLFASPLHRCCSIQLTTAKEKRDAIEIASMLIDFGADVDYSNDSSSDGMCPLHTAARVGNSSLLEFLLQHAASVHSIDVNGDTPLHHAAVGGTRHHLKCVQLLTKYGASLVWCNSQGNTAGDCARREMVLEENPSKYLCQTVSILQQLAQVFGKLDNPFNFSPSSPKHAQEERNPYRLITNSKQQNRMPQLSINSTSSISPNSPPVPPPQKNESQGTWWSILPNFIRNPPQLDHQIPIKPPNSIQMDMSKPPSDAELALVAATANSKKKRRDRNSIGSVISMYSALDTEVDLTDYTDQEEAYSVTGSENEYENEYNTSVISDQDLEDLSEDELNESETVLQPPEDVLNAIAKAKLEQTYTSFDLQP